MNCKQGDLAVIVRSWAGNEGKIVRCIRLSAESHWDVPGKPREYGLPSWVIDVALPDCFGNLMNEIADEQLRPIRDNPGEDETLSWIDVPTKETA